MHGGSSWLELGVVLRVAGTFSSCTGSVLVFLHQQTPMLEDSVKTPGPWQAPSLFAQAVSWCSYTSRPSCLKTG